MITIRRVVASCAALSSLEWAPFLSPAPSHADCQAGDAGQCGMSCPDGTVVDTQAHMCRDLWSGVDRSIQNASVPADLSSLGVPDLSALNGLPSPVQVNLPDVVLPGVGIGVVPSFPIVLAPQLPPPPQLPSLPNVSLPHF